MQIIAELCKGCKLCVPYCIVGAISIQEKKAIIDHELCVECGVCQQVNVCKSGAFVQEELEWPRAIRRTYSNVMAKHPQTGMTGRGTPEMKSNEVTGKYRKGEVGLGVELGQTGRDHPFPGCRESRKVLASSGVTFDPGSAHNHDHDRSLRRARFPRRS